MKNITRKEAEKKFPGVHFYGDIFWIGERAVIGAGAEIGERAVIGAGAVIGEGAMILSICSKYICNIIPYVDHCNIHIGCESHPVDEYIARQEELADKHDRRWWDKTGKRIFDFLVEEAREYERRRK